ncbi:M1 family aminopeptidase [Echinicola sp. 20G]|uniref:M1 family metallopeptidase n=1 Tax=Echinicola sp. 20G TaxID=2781961 RepID=UPI001F21E123|nr:M1 family aminopeptidase [Echinicola sp. 20G]
MNLFTPRILFGLCLMAGLSSCEPQKTEIPMEDGVAKNLADFRKERISEVKYTMSFDIPGEKQLPIPATLDLSFQLSKSNQDIYLDFSAPSDHLLTMMINGDTSEIIHELEHILLPAESLKSGDNEVQIEFVAGETSLNRNEEYLYTLLVPDRARSLFPCFDQPNIKATYQLDITAPKDWKVMCGAPALDRVEKAESITHQFGETDEMSTYLFSFVAGKFQVVQENRAGLDMELFYRETNKEKVEQSVPAIFELHEKSMDYLAEYTAFPFPFQKLDFAAIPIFQYGGMEHVGAIQYKEPSLFLDATATDSQLLGRAKLIAHETAHMWFGDLVTMDWFEDVWLKEVFANFMADKIVNPSFPDINHDLLFLVSHYPAAYGEDRTQGTNPIKQPLENLKYSGTLYGNIIYHKAPIMMRQLEAVMGVEAFQKGIQEYMQTYQYGNATWADLVGILDKGIAIDLGKWSDVWVNQTGRPVFSETIDYNDQGKISSMKIAQSAEDGSNNFWPQVFDLAFVFEGEVKVITVDMDKPQIEVDEAKGLPKPRAILYNSNGFGYGVFPVHEHELAYIPRLEDEVARAQGYINVYENTLTGELSSEQALEMCLDGLQQEENELIIRNISGQIGDLFWNYLSKKKQESIQSRIEKVLYERLQGDFPSNVKKTLFNLYASLAYKDPERGQLFRIWKKEAIIPGLKLNEDDFTHMAMNLLLFDHPASLEIISQTKDDISNPDKRERFEFLLPALSSDEAVRDQLASSFAEAANREKESWVSSALGYIHHPVRQQSGIKHLRMSLDLLDEVQRTGDIFFPKAWLSSSIGQYSSEEAYDILQEFLAANSKLNPVLMKKLMQASDGLLRAHMMRENENL